MPWWHGTVLLMNTLQVLQKCCWTALLTKLYTDFRPSNLQSGACKCMSACIMLGAIPQSAHMRLDGQARPYGRLAWR